MRAQRVREGESRVEMQVAKCDSGQIIVNGATLFDASEAGKDKDAELRKKRLHFGIGRQSP